MSQQINLFNPIFLKQEKIFSARTMVQALAVIGLGLVLVSAFASWQVARLQEEVRRSEARLRAEEARLAEARSQLAARKPRAGLEAEVQQAQQALETRQAVLALLEKGVLGESVGAGAYLRALARQHLEGLWLTGFELSGRDMTLAGRALRADLLPDYLRRLGRDDAFRGRSFASLMIERPKVKEEDAPPAFVEFQLRSGAPGEAP